MKSLKPVLLAVLLALGAPALLAQTATSPNPTTGNPTSLGGGCNLGSFPTLAVLNNSFQAASSPVGCLAYTGDQNLMVATSGGWVAVGGGGGGSVTPSNSIALANKTISPLTNKVLSGPAAFGFIAEANNNAAWAAFNSYLATDGCGSVELDLGPGDFYSDSIILVPGNAPNPLCVNSVIINGAGWASTFLIPNASSVPVFAKFGAYGPSINVQLKNLTIQGIGATNPDQHGLYIGGQPTAQFAYTAPLDGFYLENVRVFGFSGSECIIKGGNSSGQVPNDWLLLNSLWCYRPALDHYPAMAIWGQLELLQWNTGNVQGNGNYNNLGANLQIGIDPRQATTISAATAANPGVLTVSGVILRNGRKVAVVGANLPGALAYATPYWIANEAVTAGVQTAQLASSAANALAGTGIDLTGGVGTIANWDLVPWELLPTAVNTSTNVITTEWASILVSGDEVQAYGANLPSGLSTGVNYWVTWITDSTLALSTSLVNEQAGTYIALGTAGTIGHWGLAPIPGSSSGLVTLINVASQSSEWGFDEISTSVLFINPYLESVENGFRNYDSYTTVENGEFLNAGASCLFELDNQSAALSTSGIFDMPFGGYSPILCNKGLTSGVSNFNALIPGVPTTAGLFSNVQTFAGGIGGYKINVGTIATTPCTLTGSGNAGCSSITNGVGDCGTFIKFTDASAVTVTIPATLPVGCQVAIEQGGAGKVSVNGSAVTPATLHSAHSYTGTSGQYAVIGITIDANAGGSSAIAVLTGDGS